MKNDQLVVGSDAHVQFDGVTPFDSKLKRSHGVFGYAAPIVVQAAMRHQSELFNEIYLFAFRHKIALLV
jgi:hypothetical protein